MTSTVHVQYIGAKPAKIDNVRGSGRVWHGAGAILQIPVAEAASYLAFPDIWRLVSDADLLDQGAAATEAQQLIAAFEKLLPRLSIDVLECYRGLLDSATKRAKAAALAAPVAPAAPAAPVVPVVPAAPESAVPAEPVAPKRTKAAAHAVPAAPDLTDPAQVKQAAARAAAVLSAVRDLDPQDKDHFAGRFAKPEAVADRAGFTPTADELSAAGSANKKG